MLPSSYALPPSVLNIGGQPVASGGSGDIFKGTLDDSSVCVKRVRIYSKEGPEKAIKVHHRRHNSPYLPLLTNTQTLYREAVVWKRLEHQNIVPFLGITSSPLQLISEWMPGGDLMEYIKRHPDADSLGLVGVPLLWLILPSLPLPAVRCRRRSSHSPLPQHSSWRSQGSVWLFQTSYYRRIDTSPAEHPCGRDQPRTNHGFWSC